MCSSYPVLAGRAHAWESAVPASDGKNDLPDKKDEKNEREGRDGDGVDQDREGAAQGGPACSRANCPKKV